MQARDEIAAMKRDRLRKALARGDEDIAAGRVIEIGTEAGIALGLAGAVALGRFLADQLYGLTPSDPMMLGLAVCVVLATVAVACWRPVRRAGQVDPIAVLHRE